MKQFSSLDFDSVLRDAIIESVQLGVSIHGDGEGIANADQVSFSSDSTTQRQHSSCMHDSITVGQRKASTYEFSPKSNIHYVLWTCGIV